MLIGTNVPKLLEPWEVINSQGNGPYAVRTVLGWVVNGLLAGSNDPESAPVTVNRISVSKLEAIQRAAHRKARNLTKGLP